MNVARHRNNGNHILVWRDAVASAERSLSGCDNKLTIGSTLYSRFLRTWLHLRHTAPVDFGISVHVYRRYLVAHDSIELEEYEEEKG